MHNESLCTKTPMLLNKLIICVYRLFRRKPSTIIFQYTSGGFFDIPDYWHLAGKHKWLKVILIDKGIDRIAKQHGIHFFEGKPLFQIDLVGTLYRAVRLIKAGEVSDTHFTSDAPISRVTRFYVDYVDLQMKTYFWQTYKSEEVRTKAWLLCATEEAYKDCLYDIATYRDAIRRNKEITDKIAALINKYSIGVYAGQNLYDIEKKRVLKEAFSAVELHSAITRKDFVLTYKGSPLSALLYFQMKGLITQLQNGDYTDVVIDEEAKQKAESARQQKEQQRREEQQKKQDEEKQQQAEILIQQKRDQRNAAARANREKKKAELQAQAERDRQAAELARRQQQKRREAAKARRERMKAVKPPAKKAAPVKKIPAKKAIKRRA